MKIREIFRVIHIACIADKQFCTYRSVVFQMYEQTKQCACNFAKTYVNCAIAVKDCGARKMQKLRRICGGGVPQKSEVVSCRVHRRTRKILTHGKVLKLDHG